MSLNVLFFITVYFAAMKELKSVVVNPNTCNLKLQQLQSQIGVVTSQCRFELNSATATIKTEISSATSNINTQLTALQNRAFAIVGPNTQSCKNKLQLDLVQVNNEAAKLCFPNTGIKALNLKINQLNRLKGDSSLICDTCAQLYPLPTQIKELNNCIDDRIGGIANQATDIQAQISSDITELEGQSVECVRYAESAQLNIINNAAANFKDCIGVP